MNFLRNFVLLSICLSFVSCQSRIPDEHTSLSLEPGDNPGAPPQKLTLMWLHHSTGDYILKKGKLKKALEANNIDFYDINYKEAVVDGYSIGDHTDPEDFPKNFNTPKYFDVMKRWELENKQQHDIIMFKSCYPASNIKSEKMLENYKAYYLSMIPTFKQNPNVLFIPMTTPPLVIDKTTPENAARARKWSKWLTSEYAKNIPNVKVFNLFNSLAVMEGYPEENTLPPQFAKAKDDSHPSRKGGKAVTRLFIPWLNRAIREAGLITNN